MSALLDNLKQYEEGLITSINQTKSTGIIDQFGQAVLKGAQNIPGASQAIQLAGSLDTEIKNLTGAGSLPSRMADALLKSGNIFSGIANEINTVFNGRQYGNDTYLGSGDWMFYVQRINPGPSTGVPDDAVYPAMEWFINKLGIFVSGRNHLGALRQSVQAYIELFGACPQTTQDVTRVTAARAVMMQYMPANGQLGAWAGTVGVFDNLLINIGNNSPSTLAYLKQQYQITGSAISSILSGTATGNTYLYIAIAIVLVILFILFTK